MAEPKTPYRLKRAMVRSNILAAAGFSGDLEKRLLLVLANEHGQPEYSITSDLVECWRDSNSIVGCIQDVAVNYLNVKTTHEALRQLGFLAVARKITSGF
jgi:hypothetical protein